MPDQPNPFATELPMLRPDGASIADEPLDPEPLEGNAAAPSADAAAADAPDAPAGPELADDQDVDEYDQGEDWQRWLGPEARRSVSMTPQSWDIPDCDDVADYDDARGAAGTPVLIDRSGGRGDAALRRRAVRRSADRDGGDPDRRRGGVVLSVLLGVGLAVVVAAVVLNFVIEPGHKNTAAPTPTPAAAVAIAPTGPPATTTAPPTDGAGSVAAATDGCEQTTGPDRSSGTGPGGTQDAPSAILAFERAYYVQRSGTAARAVVAHDATVSDADRIQSGIDAVPVGTRYCVQISATHAGGGALWAVDLTEQFPGEAPVIWHQIVTVTRLDGRTLISAIGPA